MADKKDLDIEVNETSQDDLVTSDRDYSPHPRRWLMFIVYLLLALAFAVAVVFAGRWLYHRIHKSNKSASTTQTQSQTQTQTPAPTTTPPANTQTASPTTNNSTGSTSQTATQTPNTGPGDVVAIFVGTAVIVGGLHFVWSVRRA